MAVENWREKVPALKEQGLRQYEIAELLDISPITLTRYLCPGYNARQKEITRTYIKNRHATDPAYREKRNAYYREYRRKRREQTNAD